MARPVVHLSPCRSTRMRTRALPLLAAWLAALGGCAGQGPPEPTQPDRTSLAHGRHLLAQYQCGSCHVIPDVAAARSTVGPTLAAFGRRSYIAGHVPNGVDALARWIIEPAAFAPGTAMPSMGVAPDDARAMAIYLHAQR